MRVSGGVGGVATTVMGRGTEDAASEESGEDKPGVMRDESVTNAATKIQAGFRGYKVRKQLKQTGGGSVKKSARRRSSHGEVVAAVSSSNNKQRSASLEERSATTIQAGIRGFLVRKKRQEETQAATKIQAGFRGFKARRAVKTRAQVQK